MPAGNADSVINMQELVDFDAEHVVHAAVNIGENLGYLYERAEGIYLYDTEGKRYMDAASQLISCNLGHGRREIIEAAQQQLDKLQHIGQYYGHSSVPMAQCAKKLTEVTPGDLNNFWFTSGGGEATDAASRVARRYYWLKDKPAKQTIISLYMGYHGAANGPLNMTGQYALKVGFAPQSPPGYRHIPPYFCYRCPFSLEYPNCDMLCARFLETTIQMEGPDTVAAFIAEGAIGGGGFFGPPDEYWPIVRDICTKYDVLLIADEVMTGFCRTGQMFAVDNWGVVPDLMTMSKGITSGYLPFGALAIGDKVWSGLKGHVWPQQYTFSGAPVPCAAAIAAVDLYQQEDVAANARKVGQHIEDRIKSEFLPMPYVGTYSGLGMMWAMEIVTDKETKAMFDPPLGPCDKIVSQARELGLHMRQMGTNRIALGPPCTSTIEEVDAMLDILKPLVAAIEPPRSA